MTIVVGSNGGFDSNLDDAQSGTDYTALGTTLTFTGGGPNSQTVAVSTIDDTVVEGSEDYTVTIGGQTAGTIATSQANTVITDDGDSSLLSWTIVGSSTVSEGGTANYTVSYTGATLAPGQVMTIVVGSNGGFDSNLDDAQSGTDYTALGTTLTFTGGGPNSQTVAVSTIDDTVVEGVRGLHGHDRRPDGGHDRDQPGQHGHHRRWRQLAAELDDRGFEHGLRGRHGELHGLLHRCDAGTGPGDDHRRGFERRLRQQSRRRAVRHRLHGTRHDADLHGRRSEQPDGRGLDHRRHGGRRQRGLHGHDRRPDGGHDRDQPGQHGHHRRWRQLAAELDDRGFEHGLRGRHGELHGLLHRCDAGTGPGDDHRRGFERRLRQQSRRCAVRHRLHGARHHADLHGRRSEQPDGRGLDHRRHGGRRQRGLHGHDRRPDGGHDRDQPGQHGHHRRWRQLAAELDDRGFEHGLRGRHGELHGLLHRCDAGTGPGDDHRRGFERRLRQQSRRRAVRHRLHGTRHHADLHGRRSEQPDGRGLDHRRHGG